MPIVSFDDLHAILTDLNLILLERDEPCEMARLSINGALVLEASETEFRPGDPAGWHAALAARFGGFSRPMRMARVLKRAVEDHGSAAEIAERDYTWGDLEIGAPAAPAAPDLAVLLNALRVGSGVKLRLRDGTAVFGLIRYRDRTGVLLSAPGQPDGSREVAVADIALFEPVDGSATVIYARWHAHFTAADRENVAGRFDAIEEAETGAVFVWNVERQRVHRHCKTRAGAISSAKAAARRWAAAH